MTVSEFRAMFPEFARVSDVSLQAHLTASEYEVSSDVWGDSYDLAVGLLTAHRLTLSPSFNGTKMEGKDGESTYMKQFRLMMLGATSGFRVC